MKHPRNALLHAYRMLPAAICVSLCAADSPEKLIPGAVAAAPSPAEALPDRTTAVLRAWWYAGGPPPSPAEVLQLTAYVERHPTDASALFYLGLLHVWNVPSVQPDPIKGPPLITRAAALGYGPARARIALMKVTGNGAERNSVAGLRDLAAESNRGDLDAPLYLGTTLLYGEPGVKVDPAAARRYIDLALERGNVRAHGASGYAFAMAGKTSEALAAYATGARAGDAESMATLGLCKLNGAGMRRDLPAAIELCRAAAERGSTTGQKLLGLTLLDGAEKQVPSRAEAARWLKLAAGGGDVEARRALVRLYFTGSEGVPADPEAAVKLLHELAASGDVPSLVELGRTYLQGVWVTRDEAAALRHLTVAADKGSAEAKAYIQLLRERTGK